MNILVTGAGAPGTAGTVWCLRNNPDNEEVKIVGCDVRKDIDTYFLDEFYPISVQDTFQDILEICACEGIDVIVPQTTREVGLLVDTDIVPVMSSGSYGCCRANDKEHVMKTAMWTKLPTCRWNLAMDSVSVEKVARHLGYPDRKVVVKPCLGNGSRGLKILTPEPDVWGKLSPELSLEQYVLYFPEPGFDFPVLMMEYVNGWEYTVDCFRFGNTFLAIPRKRLRIVSGITFDSEVDMREDIIEASRKLAEALNLRYCFGFQFIVDFEEDKPYVIECNPRVQGTMVASAFAGFNMIWEGVKACAGREIHVPDKDEIIDGSRFRRYWGGVGYAGQNPGVRI